MTARARSSISLFTLFLCCHLRFRVGAAYRGLPQHPQRLFSGASGAPVSDCDICRARDVVEMAAVAVSIEIMGLFAVPGY